MTHWPAIRFAEPEGEAAPAVRNLTWEQAFPGSMANAAGPAVTDSTAMQVGTVYACLEKLGGAIAQLPLHHYRLDGNGDPEKIIPYQPIWWLLNESPSPAWTAASWKEWIVRCVKLRGDQHTEILRSATGAPIGLRPHHPDCIITTTVGNRLRYAARDPVTGEVHGVDQDDMLHFTGFGFDGERSMSAIRWAARNAVSNSLGAARYMAKTISEGGMPKIALEYPSKVSPDQAALLRNTFAEIYGNGEGGKLPLIMTEGGKATELSISPVDLELLAARRFDKADICEVLGVPPIIIGDGEKTSSWGTGVEQVTLGWVKFTIQPMVARWEEEMNRKLFRRAGQFIEFNLAALLRGDSKAQSEAFRAALGGPGAGDGWMHVNEVRKLSNLPKDTAPESSQLYRAQRATSTPPNAAPTA